MKILLVTNIFPPGFVGGYELGALDVARGLMARGHDLKILTSDYFTDESGELSDLDVDRSLECVSVSHETKPDSLMREGAYFNYQNLRKLGSKLRSTQPDIVLLFNISGIGTMALVQFLESIGMPTVLYLMDNVFLGLDRESVLHKAYVSTFGEFRFSKSTRIVAMSHNLTKEMSAALGIEMESVTYVPGWIDLAGNSDALGTSDERARVRFVVSSRIAPHKGTEIILQAAAELVRRGVTTFVVDVYGAGHVAQFLQNVRKRGLDNYIRYLGCTTKNDMLRRFSEYDALLFPTWEREAFGFAVGEAASMGCFPIMPARIGASEWFVDGIDCIKITRTPEALMAAMLRTISMPFEQRIALRASAMKSARRYLAFDRWISVIDQLCLSMQQEESKEWLAASRGIQSAFLFLGHMWKESLNGQI